MPLPDSHSARAIAEIRPLAADSLYCSFVTHRVDSLPRGTPAFRPGTTRTAYSLNRSTKFIDSIRGSTMAHQPPKQQKKKPQQSPKEKKAIKQQKRHAGEAVPLIRH